MMRFSKNYVTQQKVMTDIVEADEEDAGEEVIKQGNGHCQGQKDDDCNDAANAPGDQENTESFNGKLANGNHFPAAAFPSSLASPTLAETSL